MFEDFDAFDDDDFSFTEPDYILSYLVSSLVNMVGAPLGITLLVKGMVVTGTLMSEREYLSTISNMLQTQIRQSLTGLSKEEREMAEAAFDLTDLTEDFYPGADDNEDEPDFTMNSIQYIHLKDPVIVAPQPSVSFTQGILPVMRLRLANVDGWMFGTSIPGLDMDDLDIPGDNEIRH